VRREYHDTWRGIESGASRGACHGEVREEKQKKEMKAKASSNLEKVGVGH